METAGVWEDPLDHPETIIPIQKADADFLFVIGGQDKNLQTKHYADLAIKFLKDAGKSNYEVILFKGCDYFTLTNINLQFSPFTCLIKLI